MSATTPVADGSAHADARRVLVDRDAEPHRWRCPNGHTSWTRTNSHLWCKSCRAASEHDDDVHPEHYALRDAKRDVEVAFGAVVFADDLRAMPDHVAREEFGPQADRLLGELARLDD